MGLDIDCVFAIAALDDIRAILVQEPHGKREVVADKIIAFRDSLMKPPENGFEELYGYHTVPNEQDTCIGCAFIHTTCIHVSCLKDKRSDDKAVQFIKD